MAESPAFVPTVAVIAERLGVARHRVEYVIRSRQIEPVNWAGNARIFSEASVDYIASELARMESDGPPLTAGGAS